MNTRAGTYSRVSSAAQAEEDRVSLGEQQAAIENYCTDRGYEVVARYRDVASGTTRKRPEFQRMLSDARDGKFDVIVCWKTDRLSRGMYPASALMEVVESHPVRLEAVMDHLDMKMFGLLAAVGKIEIDNFKERASLGKRGVAKQGKLPVGSVPYGYDIGEEDGRPQVSPTEGPVVRRVYDAYVVDGKSIPEIVAELAACRAPRRKNFPNGRWHLSQVHRILRSQVYTGRGWYGRFRSTTTEAGRRYTLQPRESWVEIPYPRLIDDATWTRAQELATARRSVRTYPRKSTFLLQGILRCEGCGTGFFTRANNGNVKRTERSVYRYTYSDPRRYYVCRGMYQLGLDCRARKYIPAEPLEELVWREVVRVLRHPESIQRGTASEASGSDRGLTEAERNLSRILGEEDRLIRLHVTEKISEAQLQRQLKFIRERREHAEDVVSRERANLASARQRDAALSAFKEWVSRNESGLDSLDPVKRREILKLVVGAVRLEGDGGVLLSIGVPVPEFMSPSSLPSSCLSRL